MSEFHQPNNGPEYRPTPVKPYLSPEQQASPESGVINYSYIENVPSDFPQNPDKIELNHLMELDADNTIVIVGDEIVYHGGPLGYESVPGTKVLATNNFFRRKEIQPIKAIIEGKRVVAYATDHEKAFLYIGQKKQDLSVA